MKSKILWALAFLGVSAFADTPGPVLNKTCPASQWMWKVVPGQQPFCKQPYYSDIAGAVPAGQWGGITGDINNQADLQTEFGTKQNTGNYLTGLSSDVSASGPGVGAATVNSVGGSTSSEIFSATVAANAATSANTPSTLVKRDSSGGFSAEGITADLIGNVTGNVVGNASTSNAFASIPTGCSAGQFASSIAANGNLSCAVPAGTGVTAVSATLPLSSSGGTVPDISIRTASGSQSGALSSADWTTFNGKQNALSFGDLTDAGTDGITVTGGTGAVIGSGTSVAQHVGDSTHNGYLLSTDWSTFNGKQDAGNYITALTGDLSASGPGSAASTLATVNSNVGSFTYGSFTVNAKGLVTAASSGATPEVPLTFGTGLTRTVNNVTVNTSQNIAKLSNLTTNGFVKTSGADGTLGIDTSTYLTGNQTITLSGDVSGSGATAITTTIGAGKVSNSMLAGSITASNLVGTDIATVGTVTAGTWNSTPIGLAYGGSGQASANASLNAFLPAQSTHSGEFLTTNGTDTSWTANPLGTVTSVGFSVPATSIFAATGSPVTTSGTLGLTTTGTSGGIPYFSSSSVLSTSAALTSHALTLGGGAGAAPVSLGSLGTATTVLHGAAAGDPSFSSIVNADVDAAAGIVDTKLATIATAGKVSNSATTAASANTASAIVARDGSGNFIASTITAALTGNASTSTALAANPADCGSNTYATTIAANGDLTCASITNASTTATSTNTNSTIVARDGSGNFSAGTVTAALTGNATTATALSTAGTTTTVLHGNAVGAPTYGAVALTTDVSGSLPIANGGTGQTAKAAGFDALSPMSASGDIIYGGASGTGTRLAKGSDTQVLTLASGVPSWASPTTGVNAMATFGSTPNANGASISSTTLTLQPADGTNPGGVSTGAQTIAGAKTFSSGIVVGGNTTGDSNLGTITSVTDSAYYEGTFSALFNGGAYSTGHTLTVKYVKHGKAVTLYFPQSIFACGTATPAINTAAAVVPSGLRPAVQTYAPALVYNNSAALTNVGEFAFFSDGSIYIYRDPSQGTNWTGSNNCGAYEQSFTYQLN